MAAVRSEYRCGSAESMTENKKPRNVETLLAAIIVACCPALGAAEEVESADVEDVVTD